MADSSSNKRDQLWNVFSRIADQYEGLSDIEVRAELATEGKSIDELAKGGRSLIETAIKKNKQKALHAARAEYQESVSRIQRTKFCADFSAGQRRQILGALMKRRPDLGQGLLTAQHRNFEELSDTDIESALMQLAALGAWDGKLPDESGE